MHRIKKREMLLLNAIINESKRMLVAMRRVTIHQNVKKELFEKKSRKK